MNAFDRKYAVPFTLNSQESITTIPVDIQFRHMPESKRVVGLIEQLMDRFDKYALHDAKVTVVVDETHHRVGKSVFQVKVKLMVPGERLYVAQGSEQPGRHDGIYVALNSVFDSVERQMVKRQGRRSKRRNEYDEVA